MRDFGFHPIDLQAADQILYASSAQMLYLFIILIVPLSCFMYSIGYIQAVRDCCIHPPFLLKSCKVEVILSVFIIPIVILASSTSLQVKYNWCENAVFTQFLKQLQLNVAPTTKCQNLVATPCSATFIIISLCYRLFVNNSINYIIILLCCTAVKCF